MYVCMYMYKYIYIYIYIHYSSATRVWGGADLALRGAPVQISPNTSRLAERRDQSEVHLQHHQWRLTKKWSWRGRWRSGCLQYGEHTIIP